MKKILFGMILSLFSSCWNLHSMEEQKSPFKEIYDIAGEFNNVTRDTGYQYTAATKNKALYELILLKKLK